MIIMNIFLAKKLFDNTLKAKRTSQNKKKKLVITILITSFLFIITALTEVIPFAYFYDELASTYPGSVILNASRGLRQTLRFISLLTTSFEMNVFLK